MSARVSGLTSGLFRKALETVEWETRAARAISLIETICAVSRIVGRRGGAQLIPRHGRIDRETPVIDAPGQAPAVFDTLAPQPVRHVQAAHAVVAQHDQ